jgi:hypothetical protein
VALDCWSVATCQLACPFTACSVSCQWLIGHSSALTHHWRTALFLRTMLLRLSIDATPTAESISGSLAAAAAEGSNAMHRGRAACARYNGDMQHTTQSNATHNTQRNMQHPTCRPDATAVLSHCALAFGGLQGAPVVHPDLLVRVHLPHRHLAARRARCPPPSWQSNTTTPINPSPEKSTEQAIDGLCISCRRADKGARPTSAHSLTGGHEILVCADDAAAFAHANHLLTGMQHATCNTQQVTCMQHATCDMQHATCNPQHAACGY